MQQRNMITAYLLVHGHTTDADCSDGHCYEPLRKCEKLSKLMIFELLHISIDHVLQPMTFNALQGLRIDTADNMRLRMNLVLRSCVSDNPETKDVLALKRGGMKNDSCYQCILSKEDLANGTIAQSLTIQYSVKVLEQHLCGDSESKENLKQLSVLLLRPVGISWPMATVHMTLDV